MSRSRVSTGSTKRCIAQIVLAVLVVAIFAKLCLDFQRMGRGPGVRYSRTVSTLNHLQADLTDYKVTHGVLPGPNLRDAIRALEKEGLFYNVDPLGLELTKPGLDGWGREIIYEFRDPEHAVIRSVGVNGIDEKGGGDDIQREVPTPWPDPKDLR